jgi:hypothetical protein
MVQHECERLRKADPQMALVPSRYGKKIELPVKVSSVLNTSQISFVFEVTDLGLSNLPSRDSAIS